MGYIFDFTPDLLLYIQPKELCCDSLLTCVTGLCNTPTGLAPDQNAARQHLSKRAFHAKFTKDYLPSKTIRITTVLHCYGRMIHSSVLCPCVEWSNELMNFAFACVCVCVCVLILARAYWVLYGSSAPSTGSYHWSKNPWRGSLHRCIWTNMLLNVHLD